MHWPHLPGQAAHAPAPPPRTQDTPLPAPGRPSSPSGVRCQCHGGVFFPKADTCTGNPRAPLLRCASMCREGMALACAAGPRGRTRHLSGGVEGTVCVAEGFFLCDRSFFSKSMFKLINIFLRRGKRCVDYISQSVVFHSCLYFGVCSTEVENAAHRGSSPLGGGGAGPAAERRTPARCAPGVRSGCGFGGSRNTVRTHRDLDARGAATASNFALLPLYKTEKMQKLEHFAI